MISLASGLHAGGGCMSDRALWGPSGWLGLRAGHLLWLRPAGMSSGLSMQACSNTCDALSLLVAIQGTAG